MKKAMFLLLLGAGLIAAQLLAQGESAEESQTIDEVDLVGTWRWLESHNPAWGNRVIYADSLGVERMLYFSSEGSYKITVNDSLATKGTYRVVEREDPRFNRMAKMIEMDSTELMTFSFTNPDTLTLSAVAFDAGYSIYVRESDVDSDDSTSVH
jgi:hypothetical protein